MPFFVFIAFAIFSVPGGLLAARIGKKKLLLLGLALNTAAVAVPAFFNPPFPLLLACIFLLGVGTTFLQVAGNPIMRDVSAKGDYSRNLALAQGIKGIGSTRRIPYNGQEKYTSRDYFGTLSLVPIPAPKALADSLAALAEVRRKKNLPGLDRLRVEELFEGRCAQVLHVGPFSTEGPTIARLHEFIDSQAARTGKHHEIYLSDIRRAEPDRWKTILRQPMK